MWKKRDINIFSTDNLVVNWLIYEIYNLFILFCFFFFVRICMSDDTQNHYVMKFMDSNLNLINFEMTE